MPVDFKVSRSDGDTRVFNVNEIAQGLGPEVLGVAPDGMSISMKGPNGTMAVPVQQILEQRGLKLESAVPSGANYESINPGWRAAMSSLPSDDARRTFLTEQFQKEGIKNPQISGTGRDWYIFDPETKQYHGITNNPDWDSSDLVEAGMEIPRFAGAAIGAGLGAPAGPAGMMAGAAAGGTLGDMASRGVHSLIEPGVGEQIAAHPWATAGDIGLKSALDAAGAGLGGMATKALGKFASPMSTMARVGGTLAEDTGRVVNKMARVADNDVGREVLGAFIPGPREAIFAGNMARLPNQAVRGLSKLPGYIGENLPGVSNALGLAEESPLRAGIQGAADKLKSITAGLYQKSSLPTNPTNAFRAASEEAGAWLGGKPAPNATVGSEDILANLGQKIGPKTAQWGGKIGRGLENVEGVGKGLENLGKGTVGAGLKAARAGSYTMGKGGALARNASYITEPLEPRAYIRYGSEETGRSKYNLADPMQSGRSRARLNPFMLAEESL